MELQADACRLQQVLTNVSFADILTVLKTKVPITSRDIRCRIALQYFLDVENQAAITDPSYEDDLTADLLCLKRVLITVSDERIRFYLKILGVIPNRKLVAAKLLMHESNAVCRKRSLEENKSDETHPSSSKLVKISDTINSSEAVVDGKSEKFCKKLLKKHGYGNANELMAATTKGQNALPLAELRKATVTSGIIAQRVVPKDLLPCSSTKNIDYDEPGPSRRFGDTKADPRIQPPQHQEEESMKNLMATACSLAESEATTTNRQYTVPRAEREKATATVTSGIIAQRVVPEDLLPSSSTNYTDYDAPEHSRRFVDAEAGPRIQPPQPQEEESVNNLSATARSRTESEANVAPIVPPDTQEVYAYLPVDEKLVHKLLEMFPQALPDYIRRICEGQIWSEATFAEIVDVILSNENYPRDPQRPVSVEKESEPEEQLSTLKVLLPDADPAFLQLKIDELAGNQNLLRNFIEDAVDNRNYPTIKDMLRQQQLSAQKRQYTTEFNVERFLEIFPDPVAIFEDPARKSTIHNYMDKIYVMWFLKNKFRRNYVRDLDQVVKKYWKTNLMSIMNALSEYKHKRFKDKMSYPEPESQNIPLLQELAYWDHKEQILKHFNDKKVEAAKEKEYARELGLLQSCTICCEDEIMPTDILTCTGGCRFCRFCIKTSVEVAFGEGKTTFKCLLGDDCPEEFSLQVLHNVLPPKLFSILAQKKAVAEVKAAGVEDLEMCPFCDFANIPVPEDKLFRCLNPECMKESCRLCKEPSHVPLRCDEVEKDDAVKARTYIENKMTEALVRECWKCGAKFFKVEGCNKMTCTCGAKMCYICRQPVKGYKHFNGQGGDRHDLCPLFTDSFTVNENNVLKAAEEAKKEIDPAQLMYDPTADLQKHLERKTKKTKKAKNL